MKGTAVRLKAGGLERHLFVVVTNPVPPENIVLAFNLTDLKNYPTCTCVLNAGDHPFIRFPTAVRYFSPKFWKSEMLKQAIQAGNLEHFPNASEAMLAKMIAGAHLSEDLDPICLKYLQRPV